MPAIDPISTASYISVRLKTTFVDVFFFVFNLKQTPWNNDPAGAGYPSLCPKDSKV